MKWPELDLDTLERDHLVDRVRMMMQPGERAHACLYAADGTWAMPVAFTITADAWLVNARVQGQSLYQVCCRRASDGEPLGPKLPDDLMISPAQTDPAHNGRRGYPCSWPVLCDRSSPNVRAGRFVDVEVWLPPELDAREVAVTLYGITMTAREPARDPGCGGGL